MQTPAARKPWYRILYVQVLIAIALGILNMASFATQTVALPHPEDAIRVLFGIMYAEASSYHLPWLNTRPKDYSPNTRERLELGALLPATVYLRAQRVRRTIVAAYRTLFASIDVLVMPTGQTTASRIGGPARELGAAGRNRRAQPCRAESYARSERRPPSPGPGPRPRP